LFIFLFIKNFSNKYWVTALVQCKIFNGGLNQFIFHYMCYKWSTINYRKDSCSTLHFFKTPGNIYRLKKVLCFTRQLTFSREVRYMTPTWRDDNWMRKRTSSLNNVGFKEMCRCQWQLEVANENDGHNWRWPMEMMDTTGGGQWKWCSQLEVANENDGHNWGWPMKMMDTQQDRWSICLHQHHSITYLV